jgi:hypothetical protein
MHQPVESELARLGPIVPAITSGWQLTEYSLPLAASSVSSHCGLAAMGTGGLCEVEVAGLGRQLLWPFP